MTGINARHLPSKPVKYAWEAFAQRRLNDYRFHHTASEPQSPNTFYCNNNDTKDMSGNKPCLKFTH